MAIHTILYLPDPRLRDVAKPVVHFDDKLQTLIDDMFETMYDARGVGLAAPQIGVGLRLSVIDIEGDKQNQLVIINPEIVTAEGEKKFEEGCLSVPGAYDTVIRAEKVTVKALDRNGKPFEINAEGLLAECLQHEIDHMNGKLFIDLLSPLKKAMARKKLEKFKRQHARK
ncbi:peptide deformylase [Fluoribacter dumoffii]|uniref:Peptide deformylase n=1 Tax=Fluoribacter dumoffii TaxID=463 RepID=A0A377G8A4_9GAMM|nr:peptide deformylase [Fluoribacter dumoffii]KTC89469.1 polypeptide deformylase [Fluoribacter dumoffii NY 23]MCW8386735.1 peptide deformylase [Fluoribacter dumoffii]MCW8417730.1 peptide deformylase [Fluoribacter dumoffii]MCW8454428.1 peptide deformylase [Fluoribacter dumoffii]MCW8461498.1 peptide deformylase [Fluoribacter dumoffii]